jgi:beta-lactam-binding protein with PASTA domain/tRNA A-37 threonylcarbamoyl transferase component Bud32
MRDMTQPRLLGGRYELDGIVGRGGMAEVYRARDIRLDRVVAVKTLREDLARDQTFQARFRREAQSAASLNNPSIVAVYDTGEDTSASSPIPYIVMEYVDGRTLRDLLRDDRRLLPERALEITEGVLRALDYSHRNGIVHRDIKPGNVMLTRSGQVKVMDFGIARAVSDAQATMTQTAQVIGTAQYLSPEQARGERVDARSDLYSTGCLLYELLTGRPPFLGDSPVAIAYQHVRENPIPPSQLDPEVPAWADAIVLKAMAKDPRARYQSAAEMRADIQRALSGMPVAALPTGPYGPTRRMGAATALAASPTAAVTGYGYEPGTDGYYPPDGGRRRRRTALLWAIGVLVVLGVVIGAAYLVLSGGGTATAVPSVIHMKVARAEAVIRKDGLIPVVKGQSSATVGKGLVITTSPLPGNAAPASRKVTLFVSTGPQKVTVPNVIRDTVTTATSVLRARGLKARQVTDRSATGPPDTVVRQSPAGGITVPQGSTVTLYVTPGGITVPSVVNENVQLAEGQLQNAGFTNCCRVVDVTAAGLRNGTVVNQTPKAGHVVPPGHLITLYVVNNQPTPSPTPSPTSTSPSPTPTPSPSPPPPGTSGRSSPPPPGSHRA